MNNKKILVTGANGQLGSEINEIHKNYPEYDFIFCNKNDLDISNESQVNNFFTNNKKSRHIIRFILDSFFENI